MGIATPRLIGLDLHAFTGGADAAAKPPLVVDPIVTAALAGGLVVLVGAGALVVAAIGNRRRLSRIGREGDPE